MAKMRRGKIVLIALGVALCAVAVACGSAARSFISAGEIMTSHTGGIVTLLQNGNVLITGDPDSSAELYDPSTGIPIPDGRMTNGRIGHAATLLPSGKVLITGGRGYASAELYDPSSGTFLPTGSMASARASHTSTLLPDGRVLVAGGVDEQGRRYPRYIETAELYDPRSGNFVPTGSLVSGRAHHTATLLPDGKVLVLWGHGSYGLAGGPLYSSGRLASAELYDPASGLFSPIRISTSIEFGHTATLLKDGKILITGRRDPNAPWTVSAELYDLLTNRPVSSLRLPDGLEPVTATLLGNGDALITTYGSRGAGASFSAAMVYSHSTKKFSYTGPPDFPHGFHLFQQALRLPNGEVLVISGRSAVRYLPSGVGLAAFVVLVGTWAPIWIFGLGAGLRLGRWLSGPVQHQLMTRFRKFVSHPGWAVAGVLVVAIAVATYIYTIATAPWHTIALGFHTVATVASFPLLPLGIGLLLKSVGTQAAGFALFVLGAAFLIAPILWASRFGVELASLWALSPVWFSSPFLTAGGLALTLWRISRVGSIGAGVVALVLGLALLWISAIGLFTR